jgi:hypothetical protein
LNYQPRLFQSRLHQGFRAHRSSIVLCHRRGGKTVAGVAQVIRDVVECQRPQAHGAYICPTYGMAKRIAWGYFRTMLKDWVGVKFHVGELRIELGGGREIYLLGADNPDRLRGMYLDVALVDEMADCSESLIGEILRPCLAERNGRLILIGTIRGRNHFWRAYEAAARDTSGDWFTANLRPSDTRSLSNDQLAYLRRSMSDDEYRSEMLNDPDAGTRGSFYGMALRELGERGAIREVPCDPTVPVDVSFDLGFADGTAIWFTQSVGMREVRVIDFVEYTQTSFVQVIREVKAKGYHYGRWIGPHDLGVHEYSTGTTRLQSARDLGVDFEVCPQHTVNNGINSVLRVLPLCWFDEAKTREGRERLALYHSVYDEKHRVQSRQPVHDWCSHAADAFRYFAVMTDGRSGSLFAGELNYQDNGMGMYA